MPQVLIGGVEAPVGVLGEGLTQTQVMVTHNEPVQNSKQFTVVLYITSDNAGAAIAFIWAVVIRGTSSPLVVELISIRAEAFGAAPVVFIPTFWAKTVFNKEKYIAPVINPHLRKDKMDFIG